MIAVNSQCVVDYQRQQPKFNHALRIDHLSGDPGPIARSPAALWVDGERSARRPRPDTRAAPEDAAAPGPVV